MIRGGAGGLGWNAGIGLSQGSCILIVTGLTVACRLIFWYWGTKGEGEADEEDDDGKKGKDEDENEDEDKEEEEEEEEELK